MHEWKLKGYPNRLVHIYVESRHKNACVGVLLFSADFFCLCVPCFVPYIFLQFV